MEAFERTAQPVVVIKLGLHYSVDWWKRSLLETMTHKPILQISLGLIGHDMFIPDSLLPCHVS